LGAISAATFLAVSIAGLPQVAMAAQAPAAEASHDLSIAVGKSAVLTSEQPIERIAVGFGEVAEATAVGPREVLVSAKAAGSTSLIIWQQGGGKLFFDVNVRPNQFLANNRLESVRQEIEKELPGQGIAVGVENDTVFLRGTAKDLTSVDRAVAIASTLGRTVNLLYVDVPAAEPQVLLKVRFASIDRSNITQLGLNLFSTGAANTIGSTATGQFAAPGLPANPQVNNVTNPFVFSDLLNVFLFRPDLNLGATIKALETKGLLEVLAEPNVLAENGKQASFLAGGEYPYPVFQGIAGGIGSVTIQFREFGVRLDFIPTITPRGTIRLQVAPEVSSLDFSNGLIVQGFNVPALSTRKVKTEVELEERQSFAIAGLLDKRLTDTFEKMPLLGSVPVLGKLFQSKNTNKQNTELLVIVTPELVRPIPAGTAPPDLAYPKPFLDGGPETAAKTAGVIGGHVPVVPPSKTMPAEKLRESLRPEAPLDMSASSVENTSNAAPPQQPATNEAQSPGLVMPAAK
jgi:pilus assembly protein CpaC